MAEKPTHEEGLKIESEIDPEQQLARMLREKCPEDPEVKNLLINWIIEQEKQVEQSHDPEALIQFNLRRARLYFQAEYVDDALENFESAREQAWYENRIELFQTITKERDKIKNKVD